MAGTGCIVGDFNAILPGDARLAQEHGLIDAWEETRKGGQESDGYTWGTQIEEPFPPGRLDRAALFGNLVPVDVQVLPCGKVDVGSQPAGEYWSDHCGLFVKIRLVSMQTG